MPDFVDCVELAGVPVHYGKWGRRPQRLLRADFKPMLESALEALWPLLPWGTPTGILSGGAYVPREKKPGDRHAIGTAFDLSGFSFADAAGAWFWELWHKHKASPKEALAIEAVLRLHCPQVLGPWYNTAHEDHWHCDDRAGAAGFQARSKADVRFLQAALRHVWDLEPGSIDGDLGPKTLVAATRALDEIGQPEVIERPEVWRAWLNATAHGGLGIAERQPIAG
jgi:hypothetical protein